MDVHPRELVQAAARLGAAAQNALEVARFGGLETGEEPAPFDVVEDTRMYKLRRYLAEQSAPDASPVVLVPPLMLTAEVYDVAPAASAVRILADHGVDPWVIDFGAPERQEGGLERTLADHVLAVNDAVDAVREATGHDVHLGGYSQGGMFCYQAAAYRRSEGLGSVITFGSPVDTLAAMPFGLPAEAAKGIVFIAERVLAGRSVPAWVSRTSFRLMDPVKSLRQRIDFLRQLHNREALLPREGQRRFLEGEGWVAWPGPALLDFMEQFVAHNRMVSGGFRDRGPPGDARRHHLPVAVLRRRARRDRAAGGRPRREPRGTARRGLRGLAARRPLRARRRLEGRDRDLADRRRVGALARRPR
jgi:putative long chain acyl-CoA synthase